MRNPSHGVARSETRVPTIAVRIASPAEVVALAAEPQEQEPRWPPATWQAYAEANTDSPLQRVVMLAEESPGQRAGWIAGIALMGVAELEYVWVDQRHRGAGVGKGLLSAWLQWAAKKGACEALLEVRAGNEPALALYRAMRFVVLAQRAGYYNEPREDALVMRCLLVPGPL